MLVLIRGLPGSGKSTMAMEQYGDCVHYEADHYLTSCDGLYHWHQDIQPVAARLCRMHVDYALAKGLDVVVTGTFLTEAKVVSYAEMAKHCETKLKVISCTGNYKSIHSVPQFSLKAMRAAWEHIEDYEEG